MKTQEQYQEALSRAQATEEGVLVEVPETVKCQDERDKLRDALWMFRRAAANFDGLEYLRKRERRVKREKRNAAARARRQVYADLGLKRVRGNLGGIYYE